MALRDVLLKTLVLPVWTAGEAKVETWTCSACGREVDRISPAWKGIWFAAGPDEVVALCARTHRAHDRKGAPVAPGAPDEGEDWIPITGVDGEGGLPRSFVALLPPTGVAFVLDPEGRAYELRRLDELAPSDLVGTAPATALEGEVVGSVAVDDLEFDAGRHGPVAVRFA